MVLYLLHLRKFGECYRLQQDSSWVERHFSKPLVKGDFSVADAGAIRTRMIDGSFEGVKISRGPPSFEDSVWFYAVRVLHSDVPVVPSFEQLQNILVNGNAGEANTVVLNVNGLFSLASYTRPAVLAVNPQVVAFSEQFPEYSGIATKRSIKGGQVKNLYRDFVCAWASHVRSGVVGVQCDASRISLEDALKDVKSVQASWTPQF